MFGRVTMRFQPNTEAWRTIRVDEELQLLQRFRDAPRDGRHIH